MKSPVAYPLSTTSGSSAASIQATNPSTNSVGCSFRPSRCRRVGSIKTKFICQRTTSEISWTPLSRGSENTPPGHGPALRCILPGLRPTPHQAPRGGIPRPRQGPPSQTARNHEPDRPEPYTTQTCDTAPPIPRRRRKLRPSTSSQLGLFHK